jgi:four helix bundle protein
MEDGVRSFEDLEAWQLARELVRGVYAIFRREPGTRDFGLRDQIERAAVSVMTNIAEGFERVHLSEKLQFYNIARASCGEVRSLSYLVADLNYASPSEIQKLRSLLISVGKLTTGLIRSTESRRS